MAPLSDIINRNIRNTGRRRFGCGGPFLRSREVSALNWFLRFFELFLRLGWLVMTPILLTLCGKAMGLRFGMALRSAVRVAAALFGLNLMVNSLGNTLSSVVADIAANHQLALEITDAGWGASSAIASASAINGWIVPLYLAINWVMLLSRSTRTLNLDLWNLWHISFLGAMVERLTDSMAYGMVAAAAMAVVLLVFSDRCGWRMARYCQLNGASVANGFATAAVPFGLLVESILNLVPGRPRLVLDRSPEPREALASPVAWSAVLGAVLGVLAGRDGYGIAQLAMTFGSLAFLAPYLGQALSGAFAPLSEAISTFSRDKLKIKGNIYLGLSPTSSLGSGTVVVVTMMVAPIITFLAGSIPGNRFVVQGDIVMLPYIIAIIVMVCRGDLVRSLLAGVLASCTILWCSTALAELFTLSAVTANAEMYEQMGTITNFCDGGNPLAWAAVKAGEYGLAGIACLVVLAVSLAVWNRGRIVSGADVGAGAVKRRPKHIKGETPRPETAPEGVQTVPAQPEEPAAIPESSQP